jgi:ribosomal protein S18 acetylase RimI-like enzyme
VDLRVAGVDDAGRVAELHADSWRRTYRGAYPDDFLDGDVLENRRRVWRSRLEQADLASETVVAIDDDRMVGFVHTILDESVQWGSLVDNLHVATDVHRHGIGRQLMARAATYVVSNGRSAGLYLRVLEQNTRAQAFYAALGGENVGRETSRSPAGNDVVAFCYVWPDADVLVGSS